MCLPEKLLKGHYFLGLHYENFSLHRSELNLIPSSYKIPYSEKINRFETITFKEYLKVNEYRQVIKYVNVKGAFLVLKRSVIDCDLKEFSEILSDQKMASFLNQNLQEYEMLKIASTHPSGIIPLCFEASLLFLQNFLTFEILMEYGGLSLSKSLQYYENDLVFLFKVFGSIANILNHLEKNGVAHCDIKPSSFLIDSSNNLRIINFDISLYRMPFEGNEYRGISIVNGFNNVFTSPEALKFLQLKKNSRKLRDYEIRVDPWKVDVYSLGILSFILFKNFSKQPFEFLSFEKYKENRNDHLLYIENAVDFIDFNVSVDDDGTEETKNYMNFNNAISQRIRLLIKHCINFEPSKRISFQILQTFLENILTNIKDSPFEIQLQKELEINKPNIIQLMEETKDLEVKNVLYSKKIKIKRKEIEQDLKRLEFYENEERKEKERKKKKIESIKIEKCVENNINIHHDPKKVNPKYYSEIITENTKNEKEEGKPYSEIVEREFSNKKAAKYSKFKNNNECDAKTCTTTDNSEKANDYSISYKNENDLVYSSKMDYFDFDNPNCLFVNVLVNENFHINSDWSWFQVNSMKVPMLYELISFITSDIHNIQNHFTLNLNNCFGDSILLQSDNHIINNFLSLEKNYEINNHEIILENFEKEANCNSYIVGGMRRIYETYFDNLCYLNNSKICNHFLLKKLIEFQKEEYLLSNSLYEPSSNIEASSTQKYYPSITHHYKEPNFSLNLFYIVVEIFLDLKKNEISSNSRTMNKKEITTFQFAIKKYKINFKNAYNFNYNYESNDGKLQPEQNHSQFYEINNSESKIWSL